MIIDKEEHRELLFLAVKNIPISGPAGDPELLKNVKLVNEILTAIQGATVPSGLDPAVEAYADR